MSELCAVGQRAPRIWLDASRLSAGRSELRQHGIVIAVEDMCSFGQFPTSLWHELTRYKLVGSGSSPHWKLYVAAKLFVLRLRNVCLWAVTLRTQLTSLGFGQL